MALPRHRIGPCVFLFIASICCIASVAAGTLSSTVPLSLSPLSLQSRRLLSLRGGSMVKKDATTTAGGAVPPPPTTPTASAGAKTRSKNSFRQAALRAVLGGWGALQVLSILFNAIKRLVPVALEPILKRDLTPPQAVACVVWALFMAYTEGYQAFQRKFSPLVVKRAFGLAKRPTVLRVLLAGPYSMGLFGATQKRMTVSWGVTLGVVAIVQAVKKLPYPWRGIIDAGVVAGLGYGAAATALLAARAALFGWVPACDACLPPAEAAAEEAAASGDGIGKKVT
jgi:hypothetical protein